MDLVYSFFFDLDGNLIKASDILGKSTKSFRWVVPQTILLGTLRAMKGEVHEVLQMDSYAQLAEQSRSKVNMDERSPLYWKKLLYQLTAEEQVKLKKRLYVAYSKHTIAPLPGETSRQYLKRHGQRMPKKVKDKTQGVYRGNKRKSSKKEKEELREQDKWQGLYNGSQPEVAEDQASMLACYDEVMADVQLDDDADLDDVFDALRNFKSTTFDIHELQQLKEPQHRLAETRHLGDWITMNVDAEKKTLSCDCERCCRYGVCALVACMDAIHFHSAVPDRCKEANEGFQWNLKVAHARGIICDVNVEIN